MLHSFTEELTKGDTMTYDVEKIPQYPDKTETMKIEVFGKSIDDDDKLTILFVVSGNKKAAIDWLITKTNNLQGTFALIPRNQGSKS